MGGDPATWTWVREREGGHCASTSQLLFRNAFIHWNGKGTLTVVSEAREQGDDDLLEKPKIQLRNPDQVSRSIMEQGMQFKNTVCALWDSSD